MEKHLHRLGLIYRVLGWFGVAMTGVAFLFSIRDIRTVNSETDFGGIEAVFLWLVLGLLLFLGVSAFYIQFGKALQSNRRWATRVVGFIVGILLLFSFPIGTAIGAYTLWILVQIDKKETNTTRQSPPEVPPEDGP